LSIGEVKQPSVILPGIRYLPLGKGFNQNMAEPKDTWTRHGNDVVSGNMAGLMGDFTPAGLTKAMAIATNPIVATKFEVNDLGNNEVEIDYIGDKTRKIWSKWEETSPGKWQIVDLTDKG